MINLMLANVIFVCLSWLFFGIIAKVNGETEFVIALAIFGFWCITGWYFIFSALERIHGFKRLHK